MSELRIDGSVEDFINRTSSNIKIINKNIADGAFEDTQLVNSLFGLLIIPYERYFNIKERDIVGMTGYQDALRTINNKELIIIHSTYKFERDNNNNYMVYKYIWHLRNALAHSGKGRIVLLSEDGQLESIEFYDSKEEIDKNGNKHSYYFKSELKIETLRYLINDISKLYIALDRETDHSSFNIKTEKERDEFDKQLGLK